MKWFVFVAAVLVSSSANAATITETPFGDHDINIGVQGTIEMSDVDLFEKHLKNAKLQSNKRIVVELNSDGGNFASGLSIALLIHENNLTTWVPKGRLCASICAIMWLAGSDRWATNTSLIGFHAVYDTTNKQESGTGNAVLGSYLSQWGFDVSFIAYVSAAGPDEILFLSATNAQKYNVKFSGELPTEAYIQLQLQKNGDRVAKTDPAPRSEPPPPESTNGGLWASYVNDNFCMLKTEFKDGRFIGLGVFRDGVFALISKPSWSIPSNMRVAARVWIDNYPPLQGPGYAIPNLPTAMGIRVHPQFYRPLVGQMFDGWWAFVQFTGNEPPWQVSLWGVKANWPLFEQCARRVYPPFVSQLHTPNASTQPW